MGSAEVKQDGNKGETFTPVPDWLARRKDLNSTKKLVYSRLRRYEQMSGGAYPSHETLGREIGICAKQVMRCCKSLERHGLLEIHKRRRKGSQKFDTCVYRTLEPSDIDVPRTDKPDGHRRPEPTDIDVPGPSDMDVRVREKKTRDKVKKQQQGVAVGGPSAFPKTLVALQWWYAAARPNEAWEKECEASGYSDEQIADQIVRDRVIGVESRTPIPIVREAIGRLHNNAREVSATQDRPPEDQYAAELEPSAHRDGDVTEMRRFGERKDPNDADEDPEENARQNALWAKEMTERYRPQPETLRNRHKDDGQGQREQAL